MGLFVQMSMILISMQHDVLYEIRRKATCQLAAINTKFAWKLNFVAKNSDDDCDDSGTDRTTGQSRFCFWLSNHQSKCAICGNVKKKWVEVWIMLWKWWCSNGIGEYVFRIVQDLEMCQLLKCKRCSDSALDLLQEYRTNRSSGEKIRNRTPHKLA